MPKCAEQPARCENPLLSCRVFPRKTCATISCDPPQKADMNPFASEPQVRLTVPSISDLTCGMVHIASVARSQLSHVPPVGAATRKGTKNEMCLETRERPRLPCHNQDNFLIAEFHLAPLSPTGTTLETWRVYAVFDGHGLNPYSSSGARDGDVFADAAARLLARLLHDNLSRTEVRQRLTSAGLPASEAFFVAIFRSIDGALRMPRGGATLTLLVHDVTREVLHSAYVGDSLAIFLLKESTTRTGSSVYAPRWITAIPHKPTSPSERKRLVQAGKASFINPLGRLGPALPNSQSGVGLALSRCLGDASAEQFGKTSVPDVSTWNISKKASSLEYAVLASDGLWDVMSPAHVAQFIESRVSSGSRTLSSMAKNLVDLADVWSRAKFGMADDITVIIVDFRASTPRANASGQRNPATPGQAVAYTRRGVSGSLQGMREARTLP
eukprot:Polyplicarium_translucidae@DN815_c0_g1_i1.p1